MDQYSRAVFDMTLYGAMMYTVLYAPIEAVYVIGFTWSVLGIKHMMDR